jgi:hypothetical protein
MVLEHRLDAKSFAKLTNPGWLLSPGAVAFV